VSRRAAMALALAIALPACGGSSPPRASDSLQVFPASFDLAADGASRFLVGVEAAPNVLLSGGTVEVRFSFLGQGKAGTPQAYGEATAAFLPIPGQEGKPVPDRPTPTPGSSVRGVYVVDRFEFDRPGFWEAEVIADLGRGDVRRGTGAFQVLPRTLVPAPGDRTLRTENLTVDSKGVPKAAIDSRAATGGIPDPELHRITIAEAIRRGHPALVVFATPVYCVSRFCGPVTDMVQGLASDYGDRADFIHVEIWKDFQRQVINEAAGQWLLRRGNLQEPWVFLIGADGKIAARWDNVATRAEIEPFLQELPPLPGR
jgi:hypothetical protein